MISHEIILIKPEFIHLAEAEFLRYNMKSPTVPKNEESRILELESFKILDTLEEREFDEIAKLASIICETPIALVSLVGRDRQWFKSKIGLSTRETPREVSFCAHAINFEGPFVVPDAATDSRFFDNPLVVGEPKIRFYAGVPLRTSSGNALGTMCVIDTTPRFISKEQTEALSILAKQVMRLLEARRTLIELKRSHRELQIAEQSLAVFKHILDSSAESLSISDPQQPDHPIIYVNRAFEKLTGYDKNEVIGRNCRFLQGKERNQAARQLIREALEKQKPFAGVLRNFRRDGTAFWNELKITPISDDSGKTLYFLGEQRDVSVAQKVTSKVESGAAQGCEGLLGESPLIKKMMLDIKSLSQFDSTVLIEGETGAGKDLVARAIHMSSNRANHPFIAVNCGGISETLLTSQLFGHKRGSFTGAIDNAKGVFEAADNGTIFLDEIGDMPASIQVAVLRAIQDKEITRVGETSPRKINVRILTATNKNLAQLVKDGAFREDLLYRIRVARIRVPSLREHKEDIETLVKAFIAELNKKSSKTINDISEDAFSALLTYVWPGNVRELRAAIEYAFIQSDSDTIRPHDLPPEIFSREEVPSQQSEREQIEKALMLAKGKKVEAARLLGMSRATFFRRLAEYNIKAKK